MHTVKLNVHPADCSCDRSPDCHGKYVVNMPDTDLAPRTFPTLDEAIVQISEYASGPPLGAPGVHGPVRVPDHERLKH